jgi:two-component system chemotaxis sensor kinase CheA
VDTSEYLPMFLAECREHLQELNLAVVRIEEVPTDRPTLDEIFRIAHSIKGMSATMGFARIAALTHEMEDVFELLRQRTDGLPREAIDVLLACLDALSAAIDSIDTEGEEELEPEPLVVQLRSLVRERTPEQELERRGGAPSPEELRIRAHGRRVLHSVVQLVETAEMPAVRAYMVLAAAAEHGELLGSIPTEEGVELFDGRVIEVWIASEHEEEAVLRTMREVNDVARASVEETSPEEAAKTAAETVQQRTAAVERTPAANRKHSSTVRVEAERLDQLMHLMGELVVSRTRIEALSSELGLPSLNAALQDLARRSHALQAMVMQVRMVPVEAVLLRLPRLVRDLSGKLGKQVELTLTGKETELDRTVVDALGDPLVHLVRNALDHGIEPAAERVAGGKPAVATLEIAARHAGGNVVISVRDDGRGVDTARVAAKAIERGLVAPDAADTIDLHRAIELLFSPGFSTAEVTSDVSGRGVGMDAVRTTIRELGGEVTLHSEAGVGTTAHIRLPLTLAIMSTLVVEASGVPLAIPLDRVERTLSLADHLVRSVAGQRMLVLRDGVLPLIDLSGMLGYGCSRDAAHAVIVRSGEERIALAVDQLVGQRELVTRPLPAEVSGRVGLSGGAVLSNGEIALIVDCDALAERVRGQGPPLATAA